MIVALKLGHILFKKKTSNLILMPIVNVKYFPTDFTLKIPNGIFGHIILFSDKRQLSNPLFGQLGRLRISK